MLPIKTRLCALCNNRDSHNCICSKQSPIKIDVDDDIHRVIEVLALKGRWNYIEELIRLHSVHHDYAQSLRHVAYGAADSALEGSHVLKNKFNHGCLLCDGHLPYLCDGLCDVLCSECYEYESHECKSWQYKYLYPAAKKYKNKCIVCNHKATTACLSCKGHVCSTCFTDRKCTCTDYYDGSMHDTEETVMHVLHMVK